MTRQDAVAEVIRDLHTEGHEAYLVGGCVRDMILGREPKDYDVCTSATPEQVQMVFEKTIPVGAAFGVIVVALENHQIEVATFRADGKYTDGRRPDEVKYSQTADEDVRRRDFTINGLLLAQHWGNWEDHVVDYVGGMRDIKERVIRCIGSPSQRFEEDALRMLRAIRFAVQLDFTICKDTWEAICLNRHRIKNVSRERVREELFKMLDSPDPSYAVFLMNQCGLLELLFPDMVNTKLGIVLQKLRWGRSLQLGTLDMLALFASDLEYGAYLCLMESLKLSNDQFEKLRNAKSGWTYLLARDFRKADQVYFLRRPGSLIALSLYGAEAEVCHRVDHKTARQTMDSFIRVFESDLMNLKPFVNGDDLIAAGMTPGPVFKYILDELETRQLNGALRTREDALEDMRALVNNPDPVTKGVVHLAW